MRFFNKEELTAVSVILLLLFIVFLLNLRISLRRARDAQRKGDIREYSRFLDKFQDKYGFLPASSSDGKIVACNPKLNEKGTYSFEPCDWDPSDPHHQKGARYHYLSNGKRYQILASLEGTDEAEYDLKIVARNISCGKRVCNFGLSSANTPLEKSIEEIENEIRENEKE